MQHVHSRGCDALIVTVAEKNSRTDIARRTRDWLGSRLAGIDSTRLATSSHDMRIFSMRLASTCE